MWTAFINAAKARGHDVLCCTMRFPHEAIEMPCEVIYTSRQAKAPFLAEIGKYPDVWIDDMPHFILGDAS